MYLLDADVVIVQIKHFSFEHINLSLKLLILTHLAPKKFNYKKDY